MLAFLLILRIVHSPFGQVLKAIRENEPRAISLGYDVDHYKLLAFVLSAALAGLAGSLKTLVLGFATLTDVHWTMSGLVVLMTLVGGMGTMFGPLLGAFIDGGAGKQARRIGSVLARAHRHRMVQLAGRIGDHGDGPDLRGLRAALPARHRGRNRRTGEAVARLGRHERKQVV